MGADGYRWLRPAPEDVSVGVDPLAAHDSHAAWTVLQALEMPEAPDIYVNSAVDASTLEVSAYEDLVGAHGGLGGWQDRGLLIAPCHLVDAGPPIVGAEDLTPCSVFSRTSVTAPTCPVPSRRPTGELP